MGKRIVDIIIGSKTDRSLLEEAGMFEVLKRCGVSYKASVISADRNPGILKGHCEEALQNGVRTFIAGAGMAARLPGSIAAIAKYIPPVIGVPLPSDDFPDALDAILSITRAPAGCPVGCTGVGKVGLRNAALFAVQILAASDNERGKEMRDGLVDYYSITRKDPQLAYIKSRKKEV